MKNKSNLKDKTYEILKSKIISGEFKPNFRLDEREVSALIGVSRTPVREALSKLEQDDLVTIIPRKGIFVSEITLKDINDIFQIRASIEPLLVNFSIENLQDKELLRFEKEFSMYMELDSISPEDAKKLDKLDNELHLCILEASNNKHLIKLMKNVYEHNARIRNLTKQSKGRRSEAIKEHLEIVQALKSRDVEKAQNAITAHNQNSRIGFLMNIGNLNI